MQRLMRCKHQLPIRDKGREGQLKMSVFFRNTSYLRDRQALLALVALHIPPEYYGSSAPVEKDAPEDIFWALEVMISLQEDLGVEDKYLEAYLPLVPVDQPPSIDCIGAFVGTLRLTYSQSVDIMIRLILCLLSYNKYDGRGRALIRSLAHCFGIKQHDLMLMEKQLGMYISQHENEISTILHRKKSLTSRQKFMRYVICVSCCRWGIMEMGGQGTPRSGPCRWEQEQSWLSLVVLLPQPLQER